MKRGPHPKLTEPVQTKIVEAISAGDPLYLAAEKAGIAGPTPYNWMQRGARDVVGIYREFRIAVLGARASASLRELEQARADARTAVSDIVVSDITHSAITKSRDLLEQVRPSITVA